MSNDLSQGRRRGQPLVVLAIMGVAWIAARTIMWDPPSWPDLDLARSTDLPAGRIAGPIEVDPRISDVEVDRTFRVAAKRAILSSAEPVAPRSVPKQHSFASEAVLRSEPDTYSGRAPGDVNVEPISIALPSASATTSPLASSPEAPARIKAWRVDAWTAWREGSRSSRVANGRPSAASYGASQAGLLVRHDLSDSLLRPQAYVRVTHAPGEFEQSDAALGLGIRPHPRVPVRVQAEVRATQSAERTQVRPAALLVTELAPVELPLDSRLEAHAQTGWVGGAFPTGFIDGQARIDREIVRLGLAQLRLGVGAWGGAQRFAARLDMGPGVTIDVRDAGVPMRLSVDYRLRVAGNASPGDGVAVTLSTGF